MSREKSIFEQMGGTYTEIDGILYPNILISLSTKNKQKQCRMCLQESTEIYGKST